MNYTYTYKTPDGVRHESVMSATSRDEVFAALRAKGIKAIKVVAADGSKANGEVRGVRKRVVALGAAVMALGAAVAIVMAYHGGTRSGAAAKAALATPAGTVVSPSAPVTQSAQPLPRQMIPGDRQRLANAKVSLTNAAERVLAEFAEPGQACSIRFGEAGQVVSEASSRLVVPPPEEFRKILTVPLRIDANEFTEGVDLKRIIAGIKVEMRAYVAGGGTIEDYLAECVRRQNQESAYRQKTLDRLQDLTRAAEKSVGKKGAVKSEKDALAAAYAYWLKANASLQAMGIRPLEIPDVLRRYQMTLDLGVDDAADDLATP